MESRCGPRLLGAFHMKTATALGLLITCFVASLAAVEPAKDATPTKLDSVAWLTGRWQSPAGERLACEEHWSAAAGGGMVGMFRMLSGERVSVYELLLLEEESDGVWMRMRH